MAKRGIKIRFSDADKKRMIEKAQFLLFEVGLTQSKVAKELGMSAEWLGKWIKELGWNELLKNRNAPEVLKLKYSDSLSAFVAYARTKHPEEFPAINEVYQEFTNKY